MSQNLKKSPDPFCAPSNLLVLRLHVMRRSWRFSLGLLLAMVFIAGFSCTFYLRAREADARRLLAAQSLFAFSPRYIVNEFDKSPSLVWGSREYAQSLSRVKLFDGLPLKVTVEAKWIDWSLGEMLSTQRQLRSLKLIREDSAYPLDMYNYLGWEGMVSLEAVAIEEILNGCSNLQSIALTTYSNDVTVLDALLRHRAMEAVFLNAVEMTESKHFERLVELAHRPQMRFLVVALAVDDGQAVDADSIARFEAYCARRLVGATARVYCPHDQIAPRFLHEWPFVDSADPSRLDHRYLKEGCFHEIETTI